MRTDANYDHSATIDYDAIDSNAIDNQILFHRLNISVLMGVLKDSRLNIITEACFSIARIKVVVERVVTRTETVPQVARLPKAVARTRWHQARVSFRIKYSHDRYKLYRTTRKSKKGVIQLMRLVLA